eukprot:scaffold44284_cov21-Tisochrysis_lutea.AAC.1
MHCLLHLAVCSSANLLGNAPEEKLEMDSNAARAGTHQNMQECILLSCSLCSSSCSLLGSMLHIFCSLSSILRPAYPALQTSTNMPSALTAAPRCIGRKAESRAFAPEKYRACKRKLSKPVKGRRCSRMLAGCEGLHVLECKQCKADVGPGDPSQAAQRAGLEGLKLQHIAKPDYQGVKFTASRDDL